MRVVGVLIGRASRKLPKRYAIRALWTRGLCSRGRCARPQPGACVLVLALISESTTTATTVAAIAATAQTERMTRAATPTSIGRATAGTAHGSTLRQGVPYRSEIAAFVA